MTPLLFFILCLNNAGVEDCNYEWSILPLDEIQSLYGKEGNVGGFQRGNTIYAVDIKILLHEIKHLKCRINYQDETELDLCHFGIDLEYLSQGTRPDSGWMGITDNTPPLITQKMAFQKLIFSNQVIGQ